MKEFYWSSLCKSKEILKNKCAQLLSDTKKDDVVNAHMKFKLFFLSDLIISAHHYAYFRFNVFLDVKIKYSYQKYHTVCV